MNALIDSNGECIVIAESLDGYDLTGRTTIENVPEPAHEYVWNQSLQQFEPRPPTQIELCAADLRADQMWDQLSNATPQQIDTWLTNNVTNLASARTVLRFLLLAVRALRTSGTV